MQKTKTQWFLLLDGDEIWPEKQLEALLTLTGNMPQDILAVVNRTRDAVGDIWHYLPESFGHYQLLGRKGHLNIRLMRNVPYELKGLYPNEAYYFNGKSINEQDKVLLFSEAWYLHTTHLKRTNVTSGKVYGRRKKIYSRGVPFKRNELPEVLTDKGMSSEVVAKRPWYFTVAGTCADGIRKLRV